MPQQPTEIYTAATPLDAHELKNLLADEGIEALVVNDNLQAAAGEVPLGWATAARVLVGDEQAARARTIAEQFDQEIVAARRAARTANLEPRETAVVSHAVCPRCGRPRMAVCPVCETAGANFPSGDLAPNAEETDQPQLLICPTCDEPFEPGYLPRCEWCGYEFVREPPAPAEAAETETEPPNVRVVVAAAVGMLAVIAAVFGYFVWLFR